MLYTLFTKPHNKFYNDSISFETDEFIVLTHGVFLGIEATKEDRLGAFIIQEYLSKGETFANDLRGSFFISLTHKTQNKTLIYTNHVGDQRVFYMQIAGDVVVSNSIQKLVQFGHERSVNFQLNKRAAYYLLTFGYMLHDETLAAEIKRLKPGYFICYENDVFSVKPYYELQNIPDSKINEADAIETIDKLFRQAVKREFDKDREYNLRHLSTLSGGLDSRMTTWVGNDMGYKEMTTFTISQSEYLDATIAHSISLDLGLEWIFKSLDHGAFLKNLEAVMEINEGLTTYSGQTHGKSAYDLVNFNSFGLLHTGNIGDVIISSFLSSDDYGTPAFGKMTSETLKHKLEPEDLSGYINQELFLMLNRGFNGALTGNGPIQQYTEVASPFLDVDFMNYCLAIPLKLRKTHNIYKKWIIKKYPKAADYIWESLGTTIRAKTLNIRGKTVPIQKLPPFVWKGMELQLGLKSKTDTSSAFNMNPFDYWYKTNPSIPLFFNSYFNDHIHLIENTELCDDCKKLFEGSTIEKMQVLSLLAAVKLFWHTK
ncbi:MAG: asparagine synthase-related protein [Salinivirgaceae bacterium]|nr:asparagine synthase-related protein [Salinivirgaceae bacterium]